MNGNQIGEQNIDNLNIDSSLVIDSHSHLGIGFSGRIATTEEYLEIKKKYSVDISLLMPQPILSNLERCKGLFDTINNDVYEMINNSELKNSSYFIPMISPIFMTSDDIKRYIEIYSPIAFKIHYKNDYSYPDIIYKSIINILKTHDIPLIVHTDYELDTGDIKTKYKNLNSSLKWFKFFEENGLRGYLTHGARLNSTVLNLINNSENIMIGLGPDLLLQRYSKNGLESDGNYLDVLYNNVDPNKLAFDIDYNWNLDGDELDFNFINRIIGRWNSDDAKLILGKNSKCFFKIR